MIAVADPRFLAEVTAPDLVAASAVVTGVTALIGLGVYVWYAFALSKLFPKLEQDGWKGWVPVLNEATILQIGGRPAWNVVFYFIPIVQLYGLYLKVLATHDINKRFGRGAGFTVLAILLPPVWATLLAWGAPPYPEGDRLAGLHGPRRVGTDAARAAGVPSAQGYLAPPIPHGGGAAAPAPGSFAPAPGAFAPVQPAAPGAFAPAQGAFVPAQSAGAGGFTTPGFVPQSSGPDAGPSASADPRYSDAPAPDATIPAPNRAGAGANDPAGGVPAPVFEQPSPQPSSSPQPTPLPAPLPIPQGLIDSVPGAAPHEPTPAPAASAQPFEGSQPAVPGQPVAGGAHGQPVPPTAPVASAEPAQPFEPAQPLEPARRAEPVQPVAPVVQGDPGQPPSAHTFEPAAPAPVAPALVAPVPAEPALKVEPAETEVPASAAQPMESVESPSPAWPGSLAQPGGAASSIAPGAPSPHPVPVEHPEPSTDAGSVGAEVPEAPVPSPDSTPDAPVPPASDAGSAAGESSGGVPGAPGPAGSDPFAAPPRLRGGGLGARTDRAASIRPVPVVLPVPEAPIPAPAPAEAPVDDDIEATVVVQRSRGPRRVLVLDDGRTFALSATSIVIGRNPEGEPGEQRLSIPDKTRTLSKTHARLVVQGDEWRLTDLHSTNGVVVVADDGAETLLDAGESVTGAGRFVLGEVGMHVAVESGS